MAVSHVKSDTIADFTGTFTGFNSQGSTTTIAATDVVRPSDWNSAHNQFYTLSGNTTNASTASGTNVVFSAAGNLTIGGSTGSLVFSAGYSIYSLENFPRINTANVSNMTLTLLTQRPIFIPFQNPGFLTHNILEIEVSRATSGSNLFTMQAAIYSFVNSTQISRLASLQNVFSNTATASISGIRVIRLTGFEAAGSTLSPGQYVMMLYASAAATASMNYSYRGGVTVGPNVGVIGGGTDQVTTATSQLSSMGFIHWGGLWSTTTASPPASVALSNVSQHTRGPRIYFYMART